MSTIMVRLHHIPVWRPTHQNILKDADRYKVGLNDINANAAIANTGFAVHPCFLIQSPDPKGFQCAIPVQHIFGFTDDYTKVTNGMRDTLQLICKDDDALFRTVAAGAGKVVLSKLAWVVPIVQPNNVLKVNLYKSIAAHNIPVGFRIRQCETFTLP